MRIDQPDTPITAELSEDPRRIMAGNAIQYLTGCILLLEMNTTMGTDGKTLPIDNGVGTIGHGHMATDSTDSYIAMYDVRVDR